ncbi:hypothetical protein CR203_01785 [Salipaludibacillus neizhouensis]|uniref:Flagellar hook-length control protein-like C-terminal domain-containing protein n=1 Tax=Salipaludibacillus neizhouensis TaxID=885475 RepID=A0A3A9KE59_9BACI|nr:hypothetical protein [Salipaludibacillus neizhouensis]RKL68801.1 hypothetical protein CR203_01785 [Salipaludibacillus neizhouensis]
MEIQNQQLNIQTKGNERPAQLREGDIYKARVESRISDREAVLSIRGQEVRAKFEGKVPENDRINIQVQEKSNDGIKVKEVQADTGQSKETATNNPGGQSAERVLRDLGHKEPSKELVQSTQKLLDRGVPLTKESANDLKQYLESGRGTQKERGQTIEMMAQKRLEPSSSQLRAVHEALHGPKVTDQIKEMTKSVNREPVTQTDSLKEANRMPSREAVIRAIDNVRNSLQSGQNVRQSIEQLQQVVQRTGDLKLRQEVNQALREMIVTQAKIGREAAADRMLQLTQQLQKTSLSNQTHSTNQVQQSIPTVSNWLGMIENESDLSKAIATVKSEMPQASLSAQSTQQLNQGMLQATDRLESGRELKARQIMVETLQQVEQAIPKEGQAQLISDSKTEMQQYMKNDFLQSSPISSKSFLVIEVTERLAQATDQFKEFQRDMSKQLGRIDTMIQQFRQNSVQQTRPMLENVIQQLDRSIMKNDWMLFADMKTERKMLGASSDLAQAKNLLAKGNYQEARQLVRSVQQTMDAMQFKPSNQRVQHFLTQEQEWRQPQPTVHRLSQHLDHVSRSFVTQEGSGRQVFEGVRAMGMNRETELAQLLAAGKEVPPDLQQRNMKSILMQLAKGEEEGSRSQQQAQQTLQHLAGQQLVSRSDSQQNMHTLMLQIPIMLKGAAENLQVFVNSRNEGEQVDWENCNLYFHIETKKLGALGISLNVSDRTLNVTLKNDSQDFNEKAEAIGQKYLDNLKEVGFHINAIKTSTMSPAVEAKKTAEAPQEETPLLPFMTKEGFDFKI